MEKEIKTPKKGGRQMCNEIHQLLHEKNISEAKNLLEENVNYISQKTPEDLCRLLLRFCELSEVGFVVSLLQNPEIQLIILQQRYVGKLLENIIHYGEIDFPSNILMQNENILDTLGIRYFFRILKIIYFKEGEKFVITILQKRIKELLKNQDIFSLNKRYLGFVNQNLRWDYDKCGDDQKAFFLVFITALDVLYYRKKAYTGQDFYTLLLQTSQNIEDVINKQKE